MALTVCLDRTIGEEYNKGAMKVKKLEVFTVPKEGLLAYRFVDGWLRGEEENFLLRGEEENFLLRDGEIKEVRLVHDDYEVLPDTAKAWLDEVGYDPTDYNDVIEFTICSPEVQPVELAELKAKQEAAVLAVCARYRRGEITSIEALQLAKMERASSDFKVFYLEAHHILTSHLERLPRASQKITKVELAEDGVEFTVGKTRVP